MERVEKSVKEAEQYLESAKTDYESILQKEDKIWNPVVVNCIMSMIKSVDALMLENRGYTNKDHSQTSNALQELYDDELISDSFKSNVDSVRKWVVDRKTSIQYQNENTSLKETDKALKSAERLLEKTKEELELQ